MGLADGQFLVRTRDHQVVVNPISQSQSAVDPLVEYSAHGVVKGGRQIDRSHQVQTIRNIVYRAGHFAQFVCYWN